MATSAKIYEELKVSLRDKTIRSLSFSHFNIGGCPEEEYYNVKGL